MKRDTYKYELKHGKKVVYVGITKNPSKRKPEYETDKKFTHLKLNARRTTAKAAQKWEKDRLSKYRTNHKGVNPKYNKTKNR